MQMELWEFRTFDPKISSDQLVGYDVEARDGSIGKIDEATDDVGGSYVVVDTGPWIFGRKVVIPAGTIERIDPDDGDAYVALTKDQIKNAPEYDEDTGWKDDSYRSRLGTYYDEKMRQAS